MLRQRMLGLPLLLCVLAGGAMGQSQVVDVTVHSAGLEHNMLGDPADQNVSIYLPAAYEKESQLRFPVVYFLHGYSDRSPRHVAASQFQQAMDQLIAAAAVQPMIVVCPNGINKYHGSFYANSSTTGKWDDYITRDVVGYVDKNYRTQADAAHRGIVGHSMGGFGALTLAFRHPDVFGSVYAMSPCCTDLVGDMGPSNNAWVRINQLTAPDQVADALGQGQFFVAAMGGMDAALAPDPQSKILGDPPFSLDGRQVKTNPAAFARVSSNMPANMVEPLLSNILQLRGIFIEYGAQDNFSHIPMGAQILSRRLAEAGVSHTLEVYQGDHGNRIGQRISERMLPWMSRQLNGGR